MKSTENKHSLPENSMTIAEPEALTIRSGGLSSNHYYIVGNWSSIIPNFCPKNLFELESVRIKKCWRIIILYMYIIYTKTTDADVCWVLVSLIPSNNDQLDKYYSLYDYNNERMYVHQQKDYICNFKSIMAFSFLQCL